jgi:LmbE family N-acetylglucosaminyl deacetylase
MASPLKRLARGTLRRMVNKYAPPEVATAIKFLRARSNPIFPKRNIQVVGEVASGPVLILAPHPDDEAIGMGGTLCKHIENGSDVTVLYLTDGGGLGEDRHAQVQARRAEARSLAESLGFKQIFWDNRDTRLTDVRSNVDELVRILKETRPAEVYAPSIFDTHFDHFATCRILARAIQEFPSLEAMICGYEVWDNIPFPNYVVDISACAEKKARALLHYSIPLSYTDFERLCRYRNSVHYTLHVNSEIEAASKGYAEAFLRFEPGTYVNLLASYVQALREDKSELPSHLQPEDGSTAVAHSE